jgi:AraC-like DNA-binding protein
VVTNRVDFGDETFPETQCTRSRKQRAAAARIEKAKAYMLRNLNGTVRMSALSKLAGISTSSFYQLFKLATGCSPNDFFIRARMRHACGLLQETDLSVKEVAALMGYDDPFYFSRLFKAVNGVPPREYRVSLDEFESSKPKSDARIQTRSGPDKTRSEPLSVFAPAAIPAMAMKRSREQPSRV